MTPNRCRTCGRSDEKLRAKLSRKLSRKLTEIRLQTGDIRKPIYRDIVGIMFLERVHTDVDHAVEMVIKVTKNGPKIVAKQMLYSTGIDGRLESRRHIIDHDMRMDLSKTRQALDHKASGLRKEFRDKTDGKVHALTTKDSNGNDAIVHIEMTRYRPKTVWVSSPKCDCYDCVPD